MRVRIVAFCLLMAGCVLAEDNQKKDVTHPKGTAKSCARLLELLKDNTWDSFKVFALYWDDSGSIVATRYTLERKKNGGVMISKKELSKTSEKEVGEQTNGNPSEKELKAVVKLLLPAITRCQFHYKNGESDLFSNIVGALSGFSGTISATSAGTEYTTDFNSQFLERAELNDLNKGLELLRKLTPITGK